MSRAVVIVPTYNERENLPQLACRVLGLPVPVDMLVVDHVVSGSGLQAVFRDPEGKPQRVAVTSAAPRFNI